MVRWLDEVDKTDSTAVGSKASNLGELRQQGMDVPKAFIVGTDTFNQFLQANGIKQRIESQLTGLDPDDTDQLQNTAERIQRMIEDAELDDETDEELRTAYEEINVNNKVREAGNKAIELVGGQREVESVVVRSSPTGGREQGVYSPDIGVRGKDDLIDAVKDAWKAYYTAEALYYRQKRGGSDGLSVIVQKMIKADISCTVFTRHPVQDDNTILVEAVYGMGNALSDGTATPDTFTVDRETGRLQEREIREKNWNISRDPSTGKIQKQRVQRSKREERTLDSQELSEIVNTALDIEDQVGSALKIDFSIGQSKRYVLDVARSTTVHDSGGSSSGNKLLRGTVAAPGTAEGDVAITYDAASLTGVSDTVTVTVNPETDLLPHMEQLAGIVTEKGAVASNLATLARQFDLPMLVGAPNATDTLTDGSRVTVDCSEGVVLEGGLDRTAERQDLQEPRMQDQQGPMTQLTATDLYTLSEPVEHADGTVSLDRGGPRDAQWSIDAERPERRIHREFRDDFQGGALLIDSYADILRLQEAESRNAATALLHLDRLARDGPDEALEQALETARDDDHPECAVIMNSPSPGLLRAVVENGIETVIVPPDRFEEARRHLEREERRFMLSKLRDL